MNDLSKMIFCHECRYAIRVNDRFTGKDRWHCGQNIAAIGEFGDEILLSDMYGGCEFGDRKGVQRMTNKDAIEILQYAIDHPNPNENLDDETTQIAIEAFTLAIKALEETDIDWQSEMAKDYGVREAENE